MWYQAYPKFLKMTSLLHSGTLFGLDTSPRFIRLPPKKYDRPSTTELELSLQLLLVASSRIMGAPKNLELASITWVCWVVLGLQSPLSNSLLIVQECDIITSSLDAIKWCQFAISYRQWAPQKRVVRWLSVHPKIVTFTIRKTNWRLWRNRFTHSIVWFLPNGNYLPHPNWSTREKKNRSSLYLDNIPACIKLCLKINSSNPTIHQQRLT